VIDDYLAELGRQLGSVGIRGRLRRRILAESEDHLRADDGALDRFGTPAEVANTFAAELGARASRRAAVGAFLALGVAGAVYAVSFLSASFAGQPPPDTWPVLALLAFAVGILAPQVSFVAGSLAVVRVLRRREPVLPSAELTVLNRRTGVALLFGVVTMVALGVFALELRNDIAGWWLALTLAGVAIATPLLVLAALPAAGAARLRPRIAGDPGDVFDDLGLLGYRDDPWRFARRVAIGLGLVVFLVAVVQGDPLDGAVRGAGETIACLAGFAVFGRFLGLRR
jgi:hypothetical protein